MENKIIELHNKGFDAGKIAQKLKVKKVVVEEVLNETNEQNQGFGDTVEKVLENTGIKNIVEKFTDATGMIADVQQEESGLTVYFLINR